MRLARVCCRDNLGSEIQPLVSQATVLENLVSECHFLKSPEAGRLIILNP
jgi:hypothetical protein